MTGWPLCADNKLTCSPVLEDVTLIFLRLNVGHSSELWREGSFGLSRSSSVMAIDFGTLSLFDGSGVHKSINQSSLSTSPDSLTWPLANGVAISKRQLALIWVRSGIQVNLAYDKYP